MAEKVKKKKKQDVDAPAEKTKLDNRSLAVRWRPQVIDDLVGQTEIINKFRGMLKTKNIPGAIMLVGPTGCGKCVVGDTLVNTRDGLFPIEELIGTEGYNEVASWHNPILNGYGQEESPSHTYKRKSVTTKVTDESGHYIQGTPVHPMFVLDGETGLIAWKKLKDIKLNDYMIHPSTEGNHARTDLKIRFQNKTAVDNNGHKLVPIKKPSSVNTKVATLLGLMVSEGSLSGGGVRIHNKDKLVMSLFEDSVKTIAPNLEVTRSVEPNGVTRLEVERSYNLAKYLEACGLVYGHCRNVEVPFSILRGSRAVKVAFLRAYFEGDGGWDGEHRISATSASQKLIHQLSVMLRTFGIHATLTEGTRELQDGVGTYYTISIYSSSIDTFMREIGFHSKRKNSYHKVKRASQSLPGPFVDRWTKWTNTLNANGRNRDSLDRPVSLTLTEFTERPTFSNAKKLLNNRDVLLSMGNEARALTDTLEYLVELECQTSKVRSVVKDSGTRWVYDFTLPRTHSFMANGLVNHNTTVSQMIARYLNCDTLSACGECQNCTIPVEAHPDYEQVNASEKRGIDDVRAIIQRSKNKPRIGNFRILHLDEAHQLTPQAAEALLVPLEKPPESTLYIISTTNPEQLKQTMRNRCVPMTIQLVPLDQVQKRLKVIAKKEKLAVSDDVIQHMADLGQGFMRDSILLLEAAQQHLANEPGMKDDALKAILSNAAQSGGQEGLDDLAIKVLTACYAFKLKAAVKYMIDLRTDWIPFLSKCIWLNQYIIDNALIKGYHPNVWHNPLNKRFASVVGKNVEGFDASNSNTIDALMGLQRVLCDLRRLVISGGVASTERMVITSTLAGWISSSKPKK